MAIPTKLRQGSRGGGRQSFLERSTSSSRSFVSKRSIAAMRPPPDCRRGARCRFAGDARVGVAAGRGANSESETLSKRRLHSVKTEVSYASGCMWVAPLDEIDCYSNF